MHHVAGCARNPSPGGRRSFLRQDPGYAPTIRRSSYASPRTPSLAKPMLCQMRVCPMFLARVTARYGSKLWSVAAFYGMSHTKPMYCCDCNIRSTVAPLSIIFGFVPQAFFFVSPQFQNHQSRYLLVFSDEFSLVFFQLGVVS